MRKNNKDTFNDIMDKIKSQFTGDKEHDRTVITRSMQEYGEGEYGQEVVHELSKMLFNYLTPEEIEGFKKALEKDMPEQALLNSVRDDINNQRFDEAFEKLDKYMKDDTRRFVNDENYEYHSFNNDMEAALFEEYYTPEKEVRMIPFNVEITDLYYAYAFILVEKNEMDEALKYYDIALKYNPVSPNIYFEKADIYKRLGQWDNMNKNLELAYKYAYMPQDMARYYRDLGFYHTENNKADVAVALYIHSLKYDDNESAYHELQYLEHMGQDINMTYEEAKKILAENNIPLVGHEFIVSKYREFGDNFAEKNNLEAALEMYTLAYILDDSMENQIRYKMAEAAVNGDGEVNITL